MFDEETEQLAARARPGDRAATARAAAADRLQDRDDAAGRRGRRRERAERPGPRDDVQGAAPAGPQGGPGQRPRRADAVRGLRPHDVLRRQPGGLGRLRRRVGRRAPQGDAAHQPLPRHRRGGRDPARHAGRADPDRHHGLRGADAVPRRVVRQRRLPRRVRREGAPADPADGAPARRPAVPGGVRRRLLPGLPRRHRRRHGLPRRDQPAHLRARPRSPTSSPPGTAACRCSCSTCSSSAASTGSSTWRRCRRAGRTSTAGRSWCSSRSPTRSSSSPQAPRSGLWRLAEDGSIRYLREETDWHNVGGHNEAFYLRVHGAGEYRYPGADIGILVTRDRMQSDRPRAARPRRRLGQGDRRRVPGRAAAGPGGHPAGAVVRQVVLTAQWL